MLGASQHLTTVLLRQTEAWEAAFLADCQASGTSLARHLATLRARLPHELPEEEFWHGLRVYRDRAYLRIGYPRPAVSGQAGRDDPRAELSGRRGGRGRLRVQPGAAG